AVRGPLPAAAADRARLLRPTRSGGARAPGRPRAAARRARFLLPLLLVRRAARPRAPARRLPRTRPAGPPVLLLLGERELDPALGRPGGRRAAAPGLLRRVGRGVHA